MNLTFCLGSCEVADTEKMNPAILILSLACSAMRHESVCCVFVLRCVMNWIVACLFCDASWIELLRVCSAMRHELYIYLHPTILPLVPWPSGIPHLHPIILPLVPCPFWEVPWPGQHGIPLPHSGQVQVRMGYHTLPSSRGLGTQTLY